jgi:flagellar protein FliS
MNAYMSQYQNNQVLTASPEQILIMLYDGAIRFVRQAKQAIDEGKQGEKANAIGKAVAIITEFSNTLDYEVGGEIAIELNRLYDFMVTELSYVNANGDADRLMPVENILLELREAWVEAASIYNQERQTTSETSGSSIATAL